MGYIFIFESVHQVMKAERLLKSKGFKIDLIPVPREISSDCGVAIELIEELESEALITLNQNGISMIKCFIRGSNGKFERKV